MTASSLLPSKAAQYLGVRGRPNKFTKWYAGKVKNPAYLKAPWCAMFLSYCADEAGLGKVVGSFAYCPTWVNWFKAKRQWGSVPKPGAIVFFDWNKDKRADHVGVVESIRGNEIYTIEGNKANAVRRELRSHDVVLGYGYPVYVATKKPKFHTVQAGDSLIAIAKHYYSDPLRWKTIYQANRKTIGSNPALIKPGMKLVLP